MTTISKIGPKWYVVRSMVVKSGDFNLIIWESISVGYDTSEQARAQQANIVFGRV